MKVEAEIRNALDHIRCYTQRIRVLSAQQMDIDSSYTEVNPDAATRRFRALGTIHTNVDWIDVYCDNIQSNLNHATAQDINPPPQEAITNE